jgi:hypothetical protein
MGQPVIQVDASLLRNSTEFLGVDVGAVEAAVMNKARQNVTLGLVMKNVDNIATVTLGKAILTKFVAPFDLSPAGPADQYVAKVTDLVEKSEWDRQNRR